MKVFGWNFQPATVGKMVVNVKGSIVPIGVIVSDPETLSSLPSDNFTNRVGEGKISLQGCVVNRTIFSLAHFFVSLLLPSCYALIITSAFIASIP